MTDTRARRAAAGPDDVDLVARLRNASVTAAARGRDELDAEVYHACMDAAAAIEARDAEIARLEAEVASLRITLGGRTFSATAPEPIGCPAPGMCVQVAEIARMREALAGLLADTQHSGHKCGDNDCPVAAARAALAPPISINGECCHRTRLVGALCPAGRTCPHDTPAPAGWDEGTCNR